VLEAPIELDSRQFSTCFAREPMAVRHSLVDEPLLELEAIAELADSLPPGSVERHGEAANLPVVMPGGAPAVTGRPSDTVRGIETNGCWMVLWYIEQSAPYADLLRRCLAGVAPHIPAAEGTMRREESFLFLSAPNAVTPVHFDPEHNFLLQIRGMKDMNVCPFPDPAAEQHELVRYYDGGHRNLESVPSEETTFRLEPGTGVYIPSFMPHWVKNGDGPSVSLSITFRTAVSERAEHIHTVNARLRRLHLTPASPGRSPAADRAKAITYSCFLGWRSRAGRMRRHLSGRRARSPARAEQASL
jgi:JmjC domain